MRGKWRNLTDASYGSPTSDPEGGCHCGANCDRCAYSPCPLDGMDVGTRFVVTGWMQSLALGTSGEITEIVADSERMYIVLLSDGSRRELYESDMLAVTPSNI